ncbi:betaine--homocysteine S-methyltransferase 1-like [Strongylocentrotus purpuratus]|uniref:Hcy-binding domain-containing protein n=1 Tax=Strongylocentrotus purpuratus TaxID=7668 RepID=A0A7M7PLT2_STRPU|nr:betaine--homocysteine S-methyltransferase 1-like [Strongylocentrotus purpuratus]
MPKSKGLMERIKDGETVIVAEGYIFAFEHLGYLKAGPFTPEVVVDHPELVRQMYKDFVRAGSDVVQAFTYYGHRNKFKLVGREDELEKQNRLALKLAREVADETGTLMCGDLSNTFVYQPGNEEAIATTKAMFKEQVEWAVDEGADFIVGETFGHLGEAMLATQAIKEYGKGVPAVITFGTHFSKYSKDGKVLTADDVEFNDALRRLVAAGADVVGFNCMSGPTSMLPLLESAAKADIGVPIAALPVPYRTTMEEPNFTTIKDPVSGQRAFYTDLDCLLCSRTDIVKFAERCAQLKIPYVGLCCGNSPHYTRTLAETLGRVTEASKYSPDMSLHGFYGTNAGKVNTYYTKMTQDLPATKAMTAKE